MVIDSSAVLAILLNEPEKDKFIQALVKTSTKIMSPVNALESEIVISHRKGSEGKHYFDILLFESGIDIVPFDRAMNALAFEAWRKFGKGRHPAALNLGDCCAYALAAYLNEPLLYKGEDFIKTDIKSVTD